MQVHKFGGTCVAAAERISAAAKLILEEPAQQKLVVVSAMGSHPSSPVKVTDLLLNMVAKASKQDQAFLIDLAALQVRSFQHNLLHYKCIVLLPLLSGLTAAALEEAPGAAGSVCRRCTFADIVMCPVRRSMLRQPSCC